jgi:hypothetical protein
MVGEQSFGSWVAGSYRPRELAFLDESKNGRIGARETGGAIGEKYENFVTREKIHIIRKKMSQYCAG